MRIWLANPRGFCAGVERAIDVVERALVEHGAPVHVRHEIVHNERVVDALARKGAVFVQDVDHVPRGAVVVFSAHGVARDVVERADGRGLDAIDATCPLVERVHRAARRYESEGCELVVVGHAAHPEVVGTVGQVRHAQVVATAGDVARLRVRDPERLAYVTQTTLSVDETRGVVAALVARFPAIRGAATRDICYATQNRQAAALDLAARCQLVVVVGSPHSSNASRLREIVARTGIGAVQVADATELRQAWFDGLDDVGVTAGASTPEVLVQEVLARLAGWFASEIRELPGRREEVAMPLPARFARRGGDARVSA